jgi:hypothetical protein
MNLAVVLYGPATHRLCYTDDHVDAHLDPLHRYSHQTHRRVYISSTIEFGSLGFHRQMQVNIPVVWISVLRCIAVKSSVPQGMFVCFDKEVGWCVGIAVILVCREGVIRRSRWIERLRRCWEEES